ncbi:MAG: ACT domain-containing protein [Planctomycetes bacterium]|nr:ACT domain-containing protein [Planctomycetota bacterium]
MSQEPLRLHVHHERLAIVRLDPGAELPSWAQGGFVTASRTRHEFSIVCAQSGVPRDVRQERDRIGFGIVGVIPMTIVGLLASLCTALAAANVPVFVISTFDTDWVLVPAERYEAARAALEGLGHTVSGTLPES